MEWKTKTLGSKKRGHPLTRAAALALALTLVLAGCDSGSAGSAKPSSSGGREDSPLQSEFGFDLVELEGGNIYVGEVKDGVPHGTGVLTTKDGYTEKGTYVDGVKEGEFHLKSPDGTAYLVVYEHGDVVSMDTLEEGSDQAEPPAPEKTAAPEPTASPVPTPDSVPAGGAVLPSVRSFSGYRLEERDGETRSPRYLFQYDADFVKEYVALVQEYGFTLRDSELKDSYSRYIFDYTGSENVGSFKVKQGKFKDKENVELYIRVSHYSSGTENVFEVQYAGGITYAETDDRASVTVVGGGSGGEGGSSSGGAQGDCWHCGGSGRCPVCGGSGTVRKWVAGTVNDYVDQNCTDCYRPGVCRDCNGSGER